ncbi:hypothetical protein BJ085DRAFT_38245 [Dimargaris cristalligena]|uniref:G-protein coupled receptors family 1 profile domain-containing protein n=1 Tax=Dimargaris cristalligena TaxID=215637 RepID=A0A4P9ZYU2_9FUNG|nr:hypothetical protein BJ085DRAFT_38245 [Dimargaris cristalligena]|eukprot:RKP37950.1 hypothetical protein BJ085DRAFT_38245 [Dimargaris cristalligena]
MDTPPILSRAFDGTAISPANIVDTSTSQLMFPSAIPGLPALYVSNGLSIICSFAVICIYIFIRLVNAYLVKPIPLRLAFYASFVEGIFTIFRIVLIATRESSAFQTNAACGTILWFYINCSLLSLFIRILLPIHLLKILFFKQYHIPFYERQYLLLSFLASTILSCLPVISSMYGWTEMSQMCGPRPSEFYAVPSDRVNMLLWKWASYYGWIVFLVVFCLCVFLTLLYQLVRDRMKLHNAYKSGPAHLIATDESHKFWILVKKIIQRILWYPLIVILCHTVELYNAFQQITGSTFSPYGFFTSQLLLSLQAVFTLVVVFFEPSLWEAHRDYRDPDASSRNMRHSASMTPPSPQVIPWDIVIQAVEPKPSHLSPAFEPPRLVL